jgi:2-polyprenyl-6-hydroxyphenyl methylase/3-demethylubiquinone-9 3-methyltransferase
MFAYYAKRLSGERLRECYRIAPPRVQRYLEAEILHVLSRIRRSDTVLELGCGYGRVMARLAERAESVVGIDTAGSSLALARDVLSPFSNCYLAQADAVALALGDRVFDVVVCIQNGICAFGVDQPSLIRESVRVTRRGGRVLLSTYSERFWSDRLEWFELQSDAGLLGEIDWGATGDGVIVCKDGFKAATLRPVQFTAIAGDIGSDLRIDEVDDSSVFCEITV